MSSESDAFQSSFSLFSTPLPRLQQLSSLVTPPSQSDKNSRSIPRRLNAPKTAGGFAIAAPPLNPPPSYAHVVQRQQLPDILNPANNSLQAVASAMSAGVPVAPQIARQISPIMPSSLPDPDFPNWWPDTEPPISTAFDAPLSPPHVSREALDQHGAYSNATNLSTSSEFFGSDLWNPSPSQWGWSPWIAPDTSQQQPPLSFFGASAGTTLADSLIEPAMLLGSGDVLVPADALKQLMAASVSSRAGVALSVQRVGSSLLVNTLSSQDHVSFDNIDSLLPSNIPNRATVSCCLRCHLPMAICACTGGTPRKSIENGAFLDDGTLNVFENMHISKFLLAGALDDVSEDLQAALHELNAASLPSSTAERCNSPHGRELEAKSSEDSADSVGGPAQLPSSAAVLPLADQKMKKSRRGRRSEEKVSSASAVSVGPIQASDSVVTTSVAVSAAMKAANSSSNDALSASDAKLQAIATDEHENADDTGCGSAVMHREYFSHVRRVNLENLSLVIGSNLPVFQVNLPSNRDISLTDASNRRFLVVVLFRCE
jgi:hypothetical protein